MPSKQRGAVALTMALIVTIAVAIALYAAAR